MKKYVLKTTNTHFAANSVVTHDVPAYSVVAGIPAKVVKMLNE